MDEFEIEPNQWKQELYESLKGLDKAKKMAMKEYSSLGLAVFCHNRCVEKRSYRFYDENDQQIFAAEKFHYICDECKCYCSRHERFTVLDNKEKEVFKIARRMYRCFPHCFKEVIFVEAPPGGVLATARRFSWNAFNMTTKYHIYNSKKAHVLDVKPRYQWICGMPQHLDIFTPSGQHSIGRVEVHYDGLGPCSAVTVSSSFPAEFELEWKAAVLATAFYEYMI